MFSFFAKKKISPKKKKRFSDCFTYSNRRNPKYGAHIVHIILYIPTYTYNIHFTYTWVVNREIYVRVFHNAVPYNIISAILCLSVKKNYTNIFLKFKDLNLGKISCVSTFKWYIVKSNQFFSRLKSNLFNPLSYSQWCMYIFLCYTIMRNQSYLQLIRDIFYIDVRKSFFYRSTFVWLTKNTAY